MKISELIAELQHRLEKKGDLNVYTHRPKSMPNQPHITLALSHSVEWHRTYVNGKPEITGVTIMGPF